MPIAAAHAAVAPAADAGPSHAASAAPITSHGAVNVMNRKANPAGFSERIVRSQRVSRSHSGANDGSATSVATFTSESTVRSPRRRGSSASQ
ncbi:Uncharacterised protein [Burkholderia pseudomallei]|nr:Uncharacterised protein [Burkholderia pseudomallei]